MRWVFNLGRRRVGELASWYNKEMIRAPLRTKAASGFVAGSFGDAITQTLELQGKKPANYKTIKYDWGRTAGFGTFGILWTGCFNHYWLRFLNDRVPHILPKLVLQHGLINPFLYIPIFYVLTGLAKRMDPSNISDQLRAKYKETLGTTWMVWIPVTAVVFRKVPERFQSVLFASINVVWNSILSFISNRKYH